MGDRATRIALDAYEQVPEARGDYPRLTLCHLELVDDSDIARFRELGVVGAMSAAPFAGESGLTKKSGSESSAITTELVLQIRVKLGETEDMGQSADGHRINYPIVGGQFTGRGLKGAVIPGGADLSVERNDGATLIDALYRLKTDDGQVIIIHNPGIWRPRDGALNKLEAGETLAPEDYYCITTPSFKTQPG